MFQKKLPYIFIFFILLYYDSLSVKKNKIKMTSERIKIAKMVILFRCPVAVCCIIHLDLEVLFWHIQNLCYLKYHKYTCIMAMAAKTQSELIQFEARNKSLILALCFVVFYIVLKGDGTNPSLDLQIKNLRQRYVCVIVPVFIVSVGIQQ